MPITLPGTGEDVATRDNPSGEAVQDFVLVRSDALGTPVTADASGVKVQLGAALPGGSANIGDVDVLTVPADPFGANADAASATGSISAKLRQLAANGITVLAVTPGSGATNLGKAEDAAHASGDVGIMALAVRRDTAAASSGTDGDYEPLATDGTGRLRTATNIKDADDNILSFAAPAVLSVTTTDAETTALDAGDSVCDTLLQFTNAAVASGGSGHILRAVLIDADDQGIEADLYLFSGSVTIPASDAAWSLSDADAAKLIDTITFAAYEDHANNRTSVVRPAPPIPYKLDSGTTLYGALVTRGTPTYTATGLTVKLHVLKD